MGSKTYVVKCYKCKQKFEGPSLSALLSDNGIKQDRRGYYCDCKIIDEIAMRPDKKRGRKNDFDLGSFMS